MTNIICTDSIGFPTLTFTQSDVGKTIIFTPSCQPLLVISIHVMEFIEPSGKNPKAIESFLIQFTPRGSKLHVDILVDYIFDPDDPNIGSSKLSFNQTDLSVIAIPTNSKNCGKYTTRANTNLIFTVLPGSKLVNELLQPGDVYQIQLSSCFGNAPVNFITVTFVPFVPFVQNQQITVSDINVTNSSTSLMILPDTSSMALPEDPQVLIPIVDIFAQTTLNGSDIGELFTIIKDTTNYNDNKAHGRCEIRYAKPEELITTELMRCCPFIVSVLKGKGKTAKEKVLYLLSKQRENCVTLSEYNFYYNIISYSMIKYVLARLIYGEFNINILLNKYNQKCLKDLKNSRFCGAIPLFEDRRSSIYGYNIYFKWSLKTHSSQNRS